jgi:hypothetical protein
VALATHLYGPLSDHLVVDVFALFPFQRLFAMAGIAAVAAMGFLFVRHSQDCFCASFSFLS